MKTFAILIFLLCSSFTRPSGCLKMDVILVGDTSSSIGNDVNIIADAFNVFVDKFELDDNGIKMGLVTFETNVKLYSKLTSNKPTLKTAINLLREERGSMTQMAMGLTVAGNELLESGRPDAMKIIVLVTDGDPTNEEDAMRVSMELKTLLNVGICGVLIVNNDSKPEFLKSISSDFCYVESRYENLIEEFKKLDVCL